MSEAGTVCAVIVFGFGLMGMVLAFVENRPRRRKK